MTISSQRFAPLSFRQWTVRGCRLRGHRGDGHHRDDRRDGHRDDHRDDRRGDRRGDGCRHGHLDHRVRRGHHVRRRHHRNLCLRSCRSRRSASPSGNA